MCPMSRGEPGKKRRCPIPADTDEDGRVYELKQGMAFSDSDYGAPRSGLMQSGVSNAGPFDCR